MPKFPTRILTIPTAITFARLLLVPIVFILILQNQPEYKLWAFVLFVVAALTDFLDGFIARKTGTVTEFGKAIDPLVDRLLLACGVIALFIVGKLPLWILAFVILRDAILLTGFAVVNKLRVAEVKIRFVGKVATAALLTGFAALILGFGHMQQGLGWTYSDAFPGFNLQPYYIGIWFIYLGLVFSLITFVAYLWDGYTLIRATERRQD